jgi:hypothetical protein
VLLTDSLASYSLIVLFVFYFSTPGTQNDLCRRAAQCAYDTARRGDTHISESRKKMLKAYADGHYKGAGSDPKKIYNTVKHEQFSISAKHMMCTFGEPDSLHADLKCAFNTTKDVKQLIILRYVDIYIWIYR